MRNLIAFFAMFLIAVCSVSAGEPWQDCACIRLTGECKCSTENVSANSPVLELRCVNGVCQWVQVAPDGYKRLPKTNGGSTTTTAPVVSAVHVSRVGETAEPPLAYRFPRARNGACRVRGIFANTIRFLIGR